MNRATSSPLPLASELGSTRVRPLINWPKSDISDFGWRDREGAHTRFAHRHPPPPPPPQAGEGADRACGWRIAPFIGMARSPHPPPPPMRTTLAVNSLLPSTAIHWRTPSSPIPPPRSPSPPPPPP